MMDLALSTQSLRLLAVQYAGRRRVFRRAQTPVSLS